MWGPKLSNKIEHFYGLTKCLDNVVTFAFLYL